MLKFLFLLPVILSLIWIAYLKTNNHSINDGSKGFLYIAILSSFVMILLGFVSFLVD